MGKDSQFLVFVNRIMAFAVALLCIMAIKQPRHKAPLYKYSYCSFSNILSSWCQYEALKFISFPTQVLAKASKIIPVMAMGWIISRKTYEKYEYAVAMLISSGMFLFLYGSPGSVSGSNSSTTTSFSGLILLIGYMSSDAFTSNWQKELYDTYKISPFQAMCGVNLFSCLLTSVSLLQQGAFFDSLVFMSQFPSFTFDCVILSFCSAFGQVFIYHHQSIRTCGIYNNNDVTTSYCHFTILLPLWTCDNCDRSIGCKCRFHGYVSQHLLWFSKTKNNEKEKCRTYSVVSADQRAKFCLNIIIIVIYLSFDCNYIFCSCHCFGNMYLPTQV